jgi:hypothetical protein
MGPYKRSDAGKADKEASRLVPKGVPAATPEKQRSRQCEVLLYFFANVTTRPGETLLARWQADSRSCACWGDVTTATAYAILSAKMGL